MVVNCCKASREALSTCYQRGNAKNPQQEHISPPENSYLKYCPPDKGLSSAVSKESRSIVTNGYREHTYLAVLLPCRAVIQLAGRTNAAGLSPGMYKRRHVPLLSKQTKTSFQQLTSLPFIYEIVKSCQGCLRIWASLRNAREKHHKRKKQSLGKRIM